jgi:hypothetical protein
MKFRMALTELSQRSNYTIMICHTSAPSHLKQEKIKGKDIKTVNYIARVLRRPEPKGTLRRDPPAVQ